MKKVLTSIVVVCLVASTIGLTACTQSQRKDTGMVAGGVLGGVAGSELTGGSTAGTVAGAVGGAYVGRELSN
jgi:osmotically inducible lipoprotein OsmB